MSLEVSSAERYRVEGKLGAGGMGEVFRGVHVELGRSVAIKRLKPDVSQDESVVRRFVNEARAVNFIRHENIVEVTDFFTDSEGRLNMVMELLEGRSLSKLLGGEALPVGRAAHIGAQIADALSAAHKQDIVHRDLKPENVFLIRRRATDDYVKLLDFGIARLKPEAGPLEATQTGLIIGTPLYMSPEQARGQKVTSACDVYSLGVILYEMVSGHLPYPRASSIEVMMHHLATDPKPLDVPNLPVEFSQLIFACLQKKSEDRPVDIGEVAKTLERWAVSTKLSQSAASREFVHGATVMQRSDSDSTWDHEGAAKEAHFSTRVSQIFQGRPWLWPVLVGGIVVIGLGIGFWPRRGASSTEGEPALDLVLSADTERAALTNVTKELGLPPTPVDCQNRDPAAIRVYQRVANLLKKGSLGSARPPEMLAEAELETLARDVSPETDFWRARTALHLGETDDARDAAARAVAACPEMASAHAALGTAFALGDDHERAAQELLAAVDLAPDYHDARFNLAVAELGMGNLDAATAALDELERRAPETPELFAVRGRVHLLAGRADMAAADLERALAREESADLWFLLSGAHRARGNHEAAREALCQAASLGHPAANCPKK